MDDDLTRFVLKLEQNSRAVFADIVGKTHESIVDGSALTGAPGQPVDTGNLRTSWNTTFESEAVAVIQTKVEYAPFVEYNTRNVTFRNHGPHSVAMTRSGFQRIVDASVKQVVGG